MSFSQCFTQKTESILIVLLLGDLILVPISLLWLEFDFDFDYDLDWI
jgi:hypothetical protein